MRICEFLRSPFGSPISFSAVGSEFKLSLFGSPQKVIIGKCCSASPTRNRHDEKVHLRVRIKIGLTDAASSLDSPKMCKNTGVSESRLFKLNHFEPVKHIFYRKFFSYLTSSSTINLVWQMAIIIAPAWKGQKRARLTNGSQVA